MTSYEGTIKLVVKTLIDKKIESLIDSGGKSAPNSTTMGFSRTIGFQTASEPVPIVSKNSTTTKSQLSGWSDGSSPPLKKQSDSFNDHFLSTSSPPIIVGFNVDQKKRGASLSTMVGSNNPNLSKSPSSASSSYHSNPFANRSSDSLREDLEKSSKSQPKGGKSDKNAQKVEKPAPKSEKTPPKSNQPPTQSQNSKGGELSKEELEKMTKEERTAYWLARKPPKVEKVPQKGNNNQQKGNNNNQQNQKGNNNNNQPNQLQNSSKGSEVTKENQPSINQTPSQKPKAGHRTSLQFDDEKKRLKAEKKKVVHLAPSAKQVPLFAHLPQYENMSSLRLKIGFSAGQLHPAWLELGLKYAKGSIMGSNARCVAMLLAFKQVFKDFHSPSGLLFQDFDIKTMIQFLVDCRPLSISMGSAINYIKAKISETKNLETISQAIDFMLDAIDKFIQERITAADEIIARHGAERIEDGDVVLTYAKSSTVETIIKAAHQEGKKFRVIIADSRPRKEGKTLLNNLVKAGVQCTYIYINAVSYIMKEVTKVFVGAHAMMANGNVISRVGTAAIAIVAKNYHIPFLVCCETYKFTERVQLESISFNELADPDDLLQPQSEEDLKALQGWKTQPGLKLLNLAYDLTPAEFIMAVITEVGIIPPSSVPVALRVLYTMEN